LDLKSLNFFLKARRMKLNHKLPLKVPDPLRAVENWVSKQASKEAQEPNSSMTGVWDTTQVVLWKAFHLKPEIH
jgi:hypothetical protein